MTTKRNNAITTASFLYAIVSGLIVFPLFPALMTGDSTQLMIAAGTILSQLGVNTVAKEIGQARDAAVDTDLPPEWLADIQVALTTIIQLLPAYGKQQLTAEQLAELIEAQRDQPAMANALHTLIVRFHLEEALTRKQQSEEHQELLTAVEQHTGLTDGDRAWLREQFANWIHASLNRKPDTPLSMVSGKHEAYGQGEIIGLDIQGAAIIGSGTIVRASGQGKVTGTRIGPSRKEWG